MDPIPSMLIPTSAAVRKGQLVVSTEEEIDELISQLIIAKTGIRGAKSAIGAQVALDAAGDVEAQRREIMQQDAERYHGHVRALNGSLRFCAQRPGHDLGCRDADGCVIITGSEPAPDGCPSCGQVDGHRDDCERDAKLAELGQRVTVLSTVPAPPQEAAPVIRATGPGKPRLAVCGRHAAMDAAGRCDHCEEVAPENMRPRSPESDFALSPGSACGAMNGSHRCELLPHQRERDHEARIGAEMAVTWPALRSVAS